MPKSLRKPVHHKDVWCNYTGELLPPSQTMAIVTPRIKKPGLDASDISNYCPMWNLSLLSKVTKTVDWSQFLDNLPSHSQLTKFQSGFRSMHSTESALLQVLSDVYSAVDREQVTLLLLVDVSTAFDTVDHSILLERLSKLLVLVAWCMLGFAHTYSAVQRSFTMVRTLQRVCQFARVCYGAQSGTTPIYSLHGRCLTAGCRTSTWLSPIHKRRPAICLGQMVDHHWSC